MDYLLCTKWIFLIILIGLTKTVHSQFDIYTPPTINVERNWRIYENEKIDSVIARVTSENQENKNIKFGLEPLYHGNYQSPDIDESYKNNSLPFRIDPETGVVYLNESLVGRGGENFFLYVTAYDGKLPAKNEVYVNIFAKNDKKIYSGTAPPILQPTKNLSNILPPFYLLPGVLNNPQHKNLPPKPKPQKNIDEIDEYDTNLDFYQPNLNKRPQKLPPNNNNNNNEYLSNIYPNTDIDDENNMYNNNNGIVDRKNIIDNNNNNNNSSGIRTKLTQIKINNDIKIDNKFISSKNNTDQNINYDKDKIQQDIYSVKAIVPIVITICGIFLAAGIIVLVIYRKYLCAIGKSLKKKSKEEMAKKSNQSSNISSNDCDDSRNSMVLQHWNGPMAYNNRYVPWERDNQQATSQLSTSDFVGDELNGGNIQSKTDKWEFPRHRLKFFNILGEGAFGQVWRCEATDINGITGISTVAVKTLKENATELERNDLSSELQVMKSLEPHVNVIRLLGCCTDKDPIFVIIEYVNRGKLQTYLRNSRAERHYGNTHGKSNILTSGDLTSFMYQVAKGMDYLTSRGIIHRDLAARNILITDDHTCKVADFGFARDVVTSKIYERKSEGKLPIRWMAIESLYDNLFSVKSDIWSFGILMWEIVTLGSTPYPGISAADVMRKVRDGYRLEKPEHCRRELYNIMYYCWAKDANERPLFSEVVLMLDKLLHTEMDYIELERFPDHNYYNILNLSGEKV